MPEWSAYQQNVFMNVAEGRGHTIVLARAGSGKTTTIVEALKHIPRGRRALLVAFNKSIAAELKTRAPRGVDVSTLHGYGFKALFRAGAGGKCHVDANKTWMLFETCLSADERDPEWQGGGEWRTALAKTVSLAKGAFVIPPPEVLKEASCPQGTLEFASSEAFERVMRQIDDVMDAHGIDLNDADLDDDVREKARRHFIVRAIEVLAASVRMYANTRVVDFDDMIWLPLVLNLRMFTYDFVFIDETQDLNPTQIELALRACRRDGRIIAVGDDRQAIYGFRGADVDSIENLRCRLRARVLNLSVTYRCGRAIVDVVKDLVPDLEAPLGAQEGEVVRGTTDKAMLRDAGPGDFILSRSNAPLVGYCMRLLAAGKRAAIQGRDIGGSLLAMVKRSKARSIAKLLEYLARWEAAEVRRLLAKKPVPGDTALVEDKVACLRTLAESCQSIQELQARIEGLFSDADEAGRIVLSTTHKAKGLERERVFMLSWTYKLSSREEENLFYVAVTRAKKTLHFVVEDKQS